jgi:hypothetical protein
MKNLCATGDPNATISATDRSAKTQRCSLVDNRCQQIGMATAHERDCGDGFATELNVAAQEFVEQQQRRNVARLDGMRTAARLGKFYALRVRHAVPPCKACIGHDGGGLTQARH